MSCLRTVGTVAALLCGCVSMRGVAEMQTHVPSRLVVAPAGPGNPRNSEAAIVPLRDGRLLLAWTEFYAGNAADHGPARIRGRRSEDGGATWDEPVTLVENDGGCNVMEVNFVRLSDGAIALFYCQKNHEHADCRIMLRTSADEGDTWSEARQLSPAGKYTGLTNGRGVRLRSGRILLEAWEGGDSYCCLSDDEGRTWRDGGRVRPVAGPCYEPACVELRDGRVMMLMRTGLGAQFRSLSVDGGETWSVPVRTALAGTPAPVALSRVPTTGHLLAIWNNNAGNDLPGNTGRTPLTAAISRDEGETWGDLRNLEEGGHDAWAYPAVTWVGDRALVTYFTYTGGHSLVLRVVPEAWFYGE
jgi:predicted neuraminidase